MRRRAAAQAQRIRATASAIAELDVTASLAQVAAENRYKRPAFSDTGEMRIMAGRHPVIERLSDQDAGRFIPNDLYLNETSDLIAIITGPNMGGKSTYLRQAALIAILAQMGSFVPAESAMLPVIDRIFTRIGASDNLARGQSTFMVEMTETAVILNTATRAASSCWTRSGAGTATYDGLALAWAVVEYIHEKTRREDAVRDALSRADGARRASERGAEPDGVGEGGGRPHHLSAESRAGEGGPELRHRGGAAGGVAAAGDRAGARGAALHERTEHVAVEELAHAEAGPVQIQMFEPVGYGLAERIRSLDVDQLRPIEAIQLLAELQRELKR